MLGPLVRSSVLKGCPVDASDQLDVNDRAGTGKHQTIKNPESHISPVGEETPLRQCTGIKPSLAKWLEWDETGQPKHAVASQVNGHQRQVSRSSQQT